MIRRNRYVSPIKPWKHQAKALKQLHKKGSALLWADIGIGKTKIAVDYALSKGFSKVLVVGPLAAVGVWRNEFYKHDPHLHIVTSNDVATHDELLPLIHNARKQPRSVIVVTYNALVKFVKLLADSYVPDLFIVDESQCIRNYSAVRTRRTLTVARASAHRLLLSGTPCPNGYHELYYQIKAVHPGVLPPTIQGFRDRYCRLGGYMGKEIVGYKNVKELAKKLAQVTIRIPKSVLDLPPVMDQIIPVKLEPKAMKIYKKLEKEMVVDIESEGKEIKAEHHLVKLLRLQQITGGMLEGHNVSNAKLNVLKDIVQQETGKLVIFVQFVQEIRRITEMLSKLGISHDVIRGGKTGTQRDRIIEDFQTKPDPKVLVTQIQAGGVAITLTAASVAIFYSLNYNSEAYEQARGRIHRGGQTERCRYIHLLCEHTIDYDIYSALGYKMSVQELLGHVVRRYHDRASGA